MAEKLAANASQLAAAGKNATTAAAHMLNATINGTLLAGNATNGTRFIDVEEDRIAPGYAVLLMYIMLVSSGQGPAAALLCMHLQFDTPACKQHDRQCCPASTVAWRAPVIIGHMTHDVDPSQRCLHGRCVR
jgi:hypothetical protein